MKKSFLLIAMLCMALVVTFCSCKKKKSGKTLDEVTLYGTAVDASTGDPLYNVQIELEKYPEIDKNGEEDIYSEFGVIGSSTTGMDGSYEFTIYNVAQSGHYGAYAEKAGYKEDEATVSFANVKSGGRVKVDFQLQKKY